MRSLPDLSLSFCGLVDRETGCVTSTNLQFDNWTNRDSNNSVRYF
jgi:hypothetical protein